MYQMMLTVRLNQRLRDFVAADAGERSAYANISECLRELIRLDRVRVERDAFNSLKAELTQAYAAPEAAYKPLTAADVITRNRC